MSGTVNVYYIWYGNWAGNTATSILTDLADNLGGSPYFEINELYDDSSGGRVTGSVRLAGSTTDNYSQGTSLGNTWAVVQSALSGARLPVDANGVYFVLTSPDVTQSGFCTSFCGWHSYGSYSGTNNIKFAFIGDAASQCPYACISYHNIPSSPNGNPGADGMVSIIAHELEETATDPLVNAWVDSNDENADRCAWTFGATYTLGNGSKANMRIGGRDYLIQRNWVNEGSGSCGLSQAAGAFTFDEGTGTAPRSYSGSGVVGTLVGGAGWTSGIAGTAVSLNGTSAFVDTGAHVLDTSQSYTVSTWVKLNTLSGFQTMVSQDGNSVTPFYLQKNAFNNKFTMNVHAYENINTAASIDSTFVPETGVWYNVAGVYDQPNGLIKLYVNGVLQGTASFTGGWNAAGHTIIGRSKYNGNLVDFVNGVIDETSLYNRVLSDAEVQQFYQDRAGVLLSRSSCADVRSQIPSAGDGDAVIAVGGNLVTVYCRNMAGSPVEYLPLVHTGGSYNVSYYGQGPNSSGLTTNYTKVRFYPSDLTVDTTDTTFSTSSGSKSFGPNTLYSNSFADAGDCRGSGSETGTANVDLTGTAFAVAANQFSAQGWYPAGTATYSAANQIVNLTGGGDCGDMTVTPAGARLRLQ